MTTTATAGSQRSWVLRLLLGVLTLLVGIILLVWPSRSLLLIAVLFGIELIFLGAIRVGKSLSNLSGTPRTIGVVLGLLTVIAGFFCFLRPGASLIVLAIFFAIGFLIDGVVDLTGAAGSGYTGPGRGAAIFTGVLSIIAAIAVVIFPFVSLVLLAVVAGIILVVLGGFQILTAISARRG